MARSLERDLAAPKLEHATCHEDLPFGVHLEREPAGPTREHALSDRERDRKLVLVDDQPAAEIRAGGARARIFNGRAVFQKKEPGHDTAAGTVRWRVFVRPN